MKRQYLFFFSERHPCSICDDMVRPGNPAALVLTEDGGETFPDISNGNERSKGTEYPCMTCRYEPGTGHHRFSCIFQNFG
jgi:hypothetical protein